MKKSLITVTSSVLFNLLLLIFLLLGIQNSSESKRIKFLDYESIRMPISFIVGNSFISGSILGIIVFSIVNIEGKN
tara:strand:- start:82 stop:309 length:228 start_codon:yes stop_codon:yes gene_type:complete